MYTHIYIYIHTHTRIVWYIIVLHRIVRSMIAPSLSLAGSLGDVSKLRRYYRYVFLED